MNFFFQKKKPKIHTEKKEGEKDEKKNEKHSLVHLCCCCCDVKSINTCFDIYILVKRRERERENENKRITFFDDQYEGKSFVYSNRKKKGKTNEDDPFFLFC